jgi:hypothetical protein
MNRVFFLIYLAAVFTFHVSAQSKPFIGYDNIPWGASVEDVRKAYNLGENFFLKEPYWNDYNIAGLEVHYNNSSIEKKVFLFNKWNDNKYKLYRVWVTYADEEESNNTGQRLINMLTTTYGSVTRTYKDNPKRVAFGTASGVGTATHYLFNKYSPDIIVELTNTYVYANVIVFGVYQESRSYLNQIDYIWKKFSDSYNAAQKSDLEL